MAAEEQDALVAGLLERSVPERLSLSAREWALLAYADKLTRAPATVRQGDIDVLRAVGLDDRAIHDACGVIAYFAFVNRIADGLGVELEGQGNGE
jgi:uncharacterized peroxidase-related enzyme